VIVSFNKKAPSGGGDLYEVSPLGAAPEKVQGKVWPGKGESF